MVKTSKIAGNADYALVPDRLKEFRETNPRAKITTVPTVQADGGVIFQATILKDKSEETSAEATGTAMYNATEMKKAKAFEKLETVAVGRALALLGYLNNGQVATSEEMEEFEDYKEAKLFEAITLAIDHIEDANTIDQLKTIFMALDPKLIAEQSVIDAKDKRKAELSEDN